MPLTQSESRTSVWQNGPDGPILVSCDYSGWGKGSGPVGSSGKLPGGGSTQLNCWRKLGGSLNNGEALQTRSMVRSVILQDLCTGHPCHPELLFPPGITRLVEPEVELGCGLA